MSLSTYWYSKPTTLEISFPHQSKNCRSTQGKCQTLFSNLLSNQMNISTYCGSLVFHSLRNKTRSRKRSKIVCQNMTLDHGVRNSTGQRCLLWYELELYSMSEYSTCSYYTIQKCLSMFIETLRFIRKTLMTAYSELINHYKNKVLLERLERLFLLFSIFKYYF